MMKLVAGLELLIVLVGHLAIWCTVYNQLHATAWPRPSRKLLEKIIYAVILVIGFLLVRQAWFAVSVSTMQAIYRWFCIVAAIAVTVRWLYRRSTARTPSRLIEHRRRPRDLRRDFAQPPVNGIQARWLNLIPGNEIFKPVVEYKSIALRGLPRESDGLRIAQLSDLHFTGKIGIEYFQRIVALCNEANLDLVLLTGDVVDKAHCLGWLQSTLGQVQAKLGRFYVLGNHDRRVKDTGGRPQAPPL